VCMYECAVCAFVPVIFLLDYCLFYVCMLYGPSWSDLNKYIIKYPYFCRHLNFLKTQCGTG